MDAIVTAGGRIHGAWAEMEGVAVKAMLELDGATLLERTLEAVRGCRLVDRICVVGPREVEPTALRAGADLFAEEGETGIDNLLRGVNTLGAPGQVLCSASDLPFIRPSDIEDAIRLTPPDAELSYLVFSRREWEESFSSDGCFFVPLSDGEFTGGCVFVLDAGLLKRIEPVLQKAFSVRKSMTGMAGLFGPALVLRFILGRCVHRSLGPSTADLCRRTEVMLHCKSAVVRGCSPRLAADVDDQADWNAVRAASARL